VAGENLSSEVRTRLLTVSYVPNGCTTTEQFEDEIHPRLRFAHRGLVAMANNGKKNSNDSQFFITLGAVKPYLMHAIAPNSVLE
jgi:cyclophilin family peptidyl-prolyl cis-trans isomerase